jgi:hypothetical protein
MKYSSEKFDVTVKNLVACIDFVDGEIQDKMKFIVARPSIPAITGFHEAHRLDNMYMSYYLYKNNVLAIYETFLNSLNSFDLKDIPNLDHETIIKVKHRRITIADTVRTLVENMVELPDFKKLTRDEKFIKTQYVVYLDFVAKMHSIDLAINKYFDKNMDKIKHLSDFPDFVDIYTRDISGGTHSATFSKFAQILIKSTFDPNTFFPSSK